MTESNPYQPPSQIEPKVPNSDDELLTNSERSFVFTGRVLSVLSGLTAGMGAGFFTWFVLSYFTIPFLGELSSRWGKVGIVVGVALAVSALGSYLQLRRVNRYRQKMLDSESYTNRKQMVAMIEEAKNHKLKNQDTKDNQGLD